MFATLDDILDSHRTRRAVIMGVLNVTPDSFSDGGQFLDPHAAIEQARRMVEQGADIIDVGAESTRPGAQRIGACEQIERLRGVLPSVAGLGAVVSIDTTRAEVAEFALDAGAAIINDVSAGRDDPRIFPLAASRGAAVVLMHMLGDPAVMQKDPHYEDVVGEVRTFLAGRIRAAMTAGVPKDRLIVDPGIGFGKKVEHNLALLSGVPALLELGRPVMVGVSRKWFLGELTGEKDPARRVVATVAACLEAWRRGATLFRVHDVAPLAQAFTVVRAIRDARPA